MTIYDDFYQIKRQYPCESNHGIKIIVKYHHYRVSFVYHLKINQSLFVYSLFLMEKTDALVKEIFLSLFTLAMINRYCVSFVYHSKINHLFFFTYCF